MSESGHDTPEDEPAARNRPRRRRLGDPFGDVLPDTTRDERDPETAGDNEAWYRENRPPHHDRD